MTEQEYTQRLFGTPEDGVLYLSAAVMKAANFRPGNKLRIIADKEGLRISTEASHAGQPGKVQARDDSTDGEVHGS